MEWYEKYNKNELIYAQNEEIFKHVSTQTLFDIDDADVCHEDEEEKKEEESENVHVRERKPTRPPMSFMSSQKKKKEFGQSSPRSLSALNKNAKTFEPKSRSSSVTKSNPNKSRTPILAMTKAHVLQLKESQQQSEANQIKQTQINHQKQLKHATNQRLNELLNQNSSITPSAQQSIAMQNEQYQQQRQRQQQQQISVPPHPSQFSNTTAQHAHAQFAQLTSPHASMHPQSVSFQHQNAQRNAANYVVAHSHVQPQAQPILIYDKNANQAALQPINVNALHRSSSLTMSHQSSNGSLPSLQPQHVQPQNALDFVQRFAANNNGPLPSQVQHIQNINNLHLQQQQQQQQINQSFDSHLMQNNHQLLQ